MMSKSVLYFKTHRDSEGRKIYAECDYVVEGIDPTGRWWSISAYDGNGNLMANPAARYAFNASDVLRDPLGRFKISLSKSPMPGNWLPVDSDYQVQLILRLHLDASEKRDVGATYGLPEIRRLQCN